MTEWVDKLMRVKAIIYMFKKLEETVSLIRRDIEDIKKTKIKHLEIKNAMSEMKNTVHGIDNR